MISEFIIYVITVVIILLVMKGLTYMIDKNSKTKKFKMGVDLINGTKLIIRILKFCCLITIQPMEA